MNTIRLEVDSRQVASLTLSRPEVRNAFNAELIAELTEAVRAVPENVRVIVLSGEGKAFSAGADLEWMRGMAGYSREENLSDSRGLERMMASLDATRVPVVGRIHGAAIAGATGLVACCDYAIAASSTVFAFTEVRLGLVPAVISPYVVRKVGYGFARAMMLSGERFDAQRAFDAGLIHRVVADEQLDAAVEEAVDAFLPAGPQALAKTRDLLDAVWGHTPDQVADLTVETIAAVRVSDEGQEGVASFLEKRPPRWSPEESS